MAPRDYNQGNYHQLDPLDDNGFGQGLNGSNNVNISSQPRPQWNTYIRRFLITLTTFTFLVTLIPLMFHVIKPPKSLDGDPFIQPKWIETAFVTTWTISFCIIIIAALGPFLSSVHTKSLVIRSRHIPVTLVGAFLTIGGGIALVLTHYFPKHCELTNYPIGYLYLFSFLPYPVRIIRLVKVFILEGGINDPMSVLKFLSLYGHWVTHQQSVYMQLRSHLTHLKKNKQPVECIYCQYSQPHTYTSTQVEIRKLATPWSGLELSMSMIGQNGENYSNYSNDNHHHHHHHNNTTTHNNNNNTSSQPPRTPENSNASARSIMDNSTYDNGLMGGNSPFSSPFNGQNGQIIPPTPAPGSKINPNRLTAGLNHNFSFNQQMGGSFNLQNDGFSLGNGNGKNERKNVVDNEEAIRKAREALHDPHSFEARQYMNLLTQNFALNNNDNDYDDECNNGSIVGSIGFDGNNSFQSRFDVGSAQGRIIASSGSNNNNNHVNTQPGQNINNSPILNNNRNKDHGGTTVGSVDANEMVGFSYTQPHGSHQNSSASQLYVQSNHTVNSSNNGNNGGNTGVLQKHQVELSVKRYLKRNQNLNEIHHVINSLIEATTRQNYTLPSAILNNNNTTNNNNGVNGNTQSFINTNNNNNTNNKVPLYDSKVSNNNSRAKDNLLPANDVYEFTTGQECGCVSVFESSQISLNNHLYTIFDYYSHNLHIEKDLSDAYEKSLIEVKMNLERKNGKKRNNKTKNKNARKNDLFDPLLKSDSGQSEHPQHSPRTTNNNNKTSGSSIYDNDNNNDNKDDDIYQCPLHRYTSPESRHHFQVDSFFGASPNDITASQHDSSSQQSESQSQEYEFSSKLPLRQFNRCSARYIVRLSLLVLIVCGLVIATGNYLLSGVISAQQKDSETAHYFCTPVTPTGSVTIFSILAHALHVVVFAIFLRVMQSVWSIYSSSNEFKVILFTHAFLLVIHSIFLIFHNVFKFYSQEFFFWSMALRLTSNLTALVVTPLTQVSGVSKPQLVHVDQDGNIIESPDYYNPSRNPNPNGQSDQYTFDLLDVGFGSSDQPKSMQLRVPKQVTEIRIFDLVNRYIDQHIALIALALHRDYLQDQSNGDDGALYDALGPFGSQSMKSQHDNNNGKNNSNNKNVLTRVFLEHMLFDGMDKTMLQTLAKSGQHLKINVDSFYSMTPQPPPAFEVLIRSSMGYLSLLSFLQHGLSGKNAHVLLYCYVHIQSIVLLVNSLIEQIQLLLQVTLDYNLEVKEKWEYEQFSMDFDNDDNYGDNKNKKDKNSYQKQPKYIQPVVTHELRQGLVYLLGCCESFVSFYLENHAHSSHHAPTVSIVYNGFDGNTNNTNINHNHNNNNNNNRSCPHNHTASLQRTGSTLNAKKFSYPLVDCILCAITPHLSGSFCDVTKSFFVNLVALNTPLNLSFLNNQYQTQTQTQTPNQYNNNNDQYSFGNNNDQGQLLSSTSNLGLNDSSNLQRQLQLHKQQLESGQFTHNDAKSFSTQPKSPNIPATVQQLQERINNNTQTVPLSSGEFTFGGADFGSYMNNIVGSGKAASLLQQQYLGGSVRKGDNNQPNHGLPNFGSPLGPHNSSSTSNAPASVNIAGRVHETPPIIDADGMRTPEFSTLLIQQSKLPPIQLTTQFSQHNSRHVNNNNNNNNTNINNNITSSYAAHGSYNTINPMMGLSPGSPIPTPSGALEIAKSSSTVNMNTRTGSSGVHLYGSYANNNNSVGNNNNPQSNTQLQGSYRLGEGFQRDFSMLLDKQTASSVINRSFLVKKQMPNTNATPGTTNTTNTTNPTNDSPSSTSNIDYSSIGINSSYNNSTSDNSNRYSNSSSGNTNGMTNSKNSNPLSAVPPPNLTQQNSYQPSQLGQPQSITSPTGSYRGDGKLIQSLSMLVGKNMTGVSSSRATGQGSNPLTSLNTDSTRSSRNQSNQPYIVEEYSSDDSDNDDDDDDGQVFDANTGLMVQKQPKQPKQPKEIKSSSTQDNTTATTTTTSTLITTDVDQTTGNDQLGVYKPDEPLPFVNNVTNINNQNKPSSSLSSSSSSSSSSIPLEDLIFYHVQANNLTQFQATTQLVTSLYTLLKELEKECTNALAVHYSLYSTSLEWKLLYYRIMTVNHWSNILYVCDLTEDLTL